MAKKEMDKFYSRLEAEEESQSDIQSLLEQWLREGKMSEEDALNESISMFTGGIETVSCST